MELLIALIGLATAAIGAWTAYANRPARAVPAAAYPGFPASSPGTPSAPWSTGQPSSGWGPPGSGQPDRSGQGGYGGYSGQANYSNQSYPNPSGYSNQPGQANQPGHAHPAGYSGQQGYPSSGGSANPQGYPSSAGSANPQAGYSGYGGPFGGPPQNGQFPPPQPGFAPVGAGPTLSPAGTTRRYRVGTAVRDAGIIFAATAVMGFLIGLGSGGDVESVLGLVVVLGLVMMLVGFVVAAVLAGRDRWRHLLTMALVTWLLGLFNVVLESSTIGEWFISLFLLAFLTGLAGLIAMAVDALRGTSRQR